MSRSSRAGRRPALRSVGAPAVLALLSMTSLTAAAQDPVIDIPTGSSVTPLVAVSDCVPREEGAAGLEACAVIARVLRDDLAFEGLFELVDPGRAGAASAGDSGAGDPLAWRPFDADYLIATTAAVERDRLAVEVRVWARAGLRSILDKRYSGPADNPRFFAHTLSDAFMSLTSHRGVARTRIAFVSDGGGDIRAKDVYVADYDGHRATRFTEDGLTSILPHWSPDGTHLVYTFIARGASDAIVAPLHGGEARPLGSDGSRCAAAEWSPDGRSIAYSRTGGDGATKIWVSDADGGNPRQLTDGPGADTAPSWSPTGRQVVFTSDRSGSPQLWLVDAEGLGLERLTRVGRYNDAPSWSPSPIHSEIAYTARLEPGRFDIAVIDFASRQVRQITTGMGSCEKPTWSPSGRHLLFACRRDGRWRLAVSHRLGRRVRTLDTGPGNSSQPAWGPFRD